MKPKHITALLLALAVLGAVFFTSHSLVAANIAALATLGVLLLIQQRQHSSE